MMRIAGFILAVLGLSCVLWNLWTMPLFGLPGSGTDHGFYIVLGLALMMLAFVMIFVEND